MEFFVCCGKTFAAIFALRKVTVHKWVHFQLVYILTLCVREIYLLVSTKIN